MYDERQCWFRTGRSADHLQPIAPFPVFLAQGRAETPRRKHLKMNKPNWEQTKRNIGINKSHINTLWDCYHEKKFNNSKQVKLQRWTSSFNAENRAAYSTCKKTKTGSSYQIKSRNKMHWKQTTTQIRYMFDGKTSNKQQAWQEEKPMQTRCIENKVKHDTRNERCKTKFAKKGRKWENT